MENSSSSDSATDDKVPNAAHGMEAPHSVLGAGDSASRKGSAADKGSGADKESAAGQPITHVAYQPPRVVLEKILGPRRLTRQASAAAAAAMVSNFQVIKRNKPSPTRGSGDSAATSSPDISATIETIMRSARNPPSPDKETIQKRPVELKTTESREREMGRERAEKVRQLTESTDRLFPTPKPRLLIRGCEKRRSSFSWNMDWWTWGHLGD